LLPVLVSCSIRRKAGKEGGGPTNREFIPAKRDFPGSFPLVIAFPGVAYYLSGPQQASPSDGFFEKGARVRLVSNAGSYSMVESESGVTAYVSTDSFRKAQ
jgi:hypothetical protein